MIEKGLDAEEAAGLVNRLFVRRAKELAKTRARSLFRNRSSAAQIQTTLVAEGHSQDAASAAVNELLEEWTREEIEQRSNPSHVWRMLGISGIAVGFLLALGNRSGMVPTFSYSDTLFIGIGIIALMMSRDAGKSARG